MINHVRTLLLNRNLPNNSQYGSEYTDPSFVPLLLTPHGEVIHETLFGSDPDELTLNYRVSQYLNLLYSDPEIKPYLDLIDPRNTYRDDVWYLFPFTTTVQRNNDSFMADYLTVIGKYIGQDSFGQNLMNIQLELNANLVPPQLKFTYQNHSLPARVVLMRDLNTYPAQLITNPDLPGLIFSFTEGDILVASLTYENVEARAEPSRNLGDIANTLITAGAMNFDFKIPAEFVDKFAALSRNRTSSLMKMAGILLSYIYENETVRLNG